MGSYSVVLCDPPWPFACYNVAKATRHVSYHYPTMRLDEIAALPVADLTASDAALCLWVTGPQLAAGVRIIEQWGFTYKTILLSWTKMTRDGKKPRTGMGFYTRANVELCLLATRGRALKRRARNVSQIILEPPREHSRKPDSAYERIERLLGDVPRVELFARTRRAGWDVAYSPEADRYRDLWTPPAMEVGA